MVEDRMMCPQCGEVQRKYEYENRFWCLSCDKEVQ